MNSQLTGRNNRKVTFVLPDHGSGRYSRPIVSGEPRSYINHLMEHEAEMPKIVSFPPYENMWHPTTTKPIHTSNKELLVDVAMQIGTVTSIFCRVLIMLTLWPYFRALQNSYGAFSHIVYVDLFMPLLVIYLLGNFLSDIVIFIRACHFFIYCSPKYKMTLTEFRNHKNILLPVFIGFAIFLCTETYLLSYAFLTLKYCRLFDSVIWTVWGAYKNSFGIAFIICVSGVIDPISYIIILAPIIYKKMCLPPAECFFLDFKQNEYVSVNNDCDFLKNNQEAATLLLCILCFHLKLWIIYQHETLFTTIHHIAFEHPGLLYGLAVFMLIDGMSVNIGAFGAKLACQASDNRLASLLPQNLRSWRGLVHSIRHGQLWTIIDLLCTIILFVTLIYWILNDDITKTSLYTRYSHLQTPNIT
ncbi:hypothetical protein NEHOM01_2025 [Nematocida homosporus]|uniref:uncharacterized protein n=1 Tax=Nematocida homosporus TaxID=1912981 RepID=UPI0022206524|nr:uncharacterized protein NEHOM01_2025 [Nematocida homosporus]KAI5187229.1 hypothetical protein NEHOM01_2025 [Nematocida homosporus]